jgi:hypothetical protein
MPDRPWSQPGYGMATSSMKQLWSVAWFLVCWSLGSGSAQAVLLDWSGVSWTGGTLANSYNPDSTFVGDDLTIAVSGDTGKLRSGYPKIDSTFNSVNALQLLGDFNKEEQSLTVTVTFNYNTWLANGAYDVSFQLFDIDTDGTYVDQIRSITATTLQGGTIGATLTGGSSVALANNGTVSATATGTALEGPSSTGGNLNVDFGTNIITELTFTFGNDPGAKNNPREQDLGIYNITFKKHAIPETGTSLIAAAGCGLTALFGRWRWRRSRLRGRGGDNQTLRQ